MWKKPRVRTLIDINMLKGPKHSINLHGGIFPIFFDYSEKESAQKTQF